MNLSDLERRDVRGPIFSADLCTYARTVWLRVERRDARGPILSADLCTYARIVWLTTIQLGMITRVEQRHASRGSPASHPKGRGPTLPKFWDPYLCPRRLTSTTKFGMNNTSKKNRVLGSMPRNQRGQSASLPNYWYATHVHTVWHGATKVWRMIEVDEWKVLKGYHVPGTWRRRYELKLL